MDFQSAATEFLCELPEFAEIRNIVLDNSQGQCWLIGGTLFKGIAHKVYGSPVPQADYDFIVELPKENTTLPPDWTLTSNSFGNPKFVKRSLKVDFVPLGNIYSVVQRGLPADIAHFLSGVPLTVQSIAYEINSRKLLGEVGLRALRERKVEICNLDFARYAVARKNTTLRNYMESKSAGLEFEILCPYD